MVEISAQVVPDVVWLVGASGTENGKHQDHTPQFLAEGIWRNGYTTKYLDLVKSMKPGERIAIKAAYTRKNGLPFDNRGHMVSVLAIKAVGVITENANDGRHVKVRWTALDPPREWFFYTFRPTVWRVTPDNWMSEGLIRFVFANHEQDIDRFRNAPNWRERFGLLASGKHRFNWTNFYEAVADKLLDFRHDRKRLIQGLKKISARIEGLGYLSDDQHSDGGSGFVNDICPFTAIGTFNRGITDENRKAIATELASLLGVSEPVPNSFEAIPILNNMRSWFFPFEAQRDKDHIDALWNVFAAAMSFSSLDDLDEISRTEFSEAFDDASARRGVGWNLTMGLYWVRPWAFVSLDSNSRIYLREKLQISLGKSGAKGRCSAADYLTAMDTLRPRFAEPSYPVHSFPELSLEAWSFKEPPRGEKPPAVQAIDADDELDDLSTSNDQTVTPPPVISYGADDIVKDGCFLDRSEIVTLIDRLRTKKNVILQGPPGTGKTWIAKRLAFGLIGQKDESKIRVVQFHPNLSYEDFVRGWRPTNDGKLALVDGIFMEAIKAASKSPESKFAVIIEEINRGNPAQIFGELLTLLEASKRTPSEAVELCYPDSDGQRRIHVPSNLYVIGTMNIADRSLALVDLALRRRFAFATLEPRLGSVWRAWVVNECGVQPDLVDSIERRIAELNEQIAAKLGTQFQLGHSFVTPFERLEDGGTREWFRQVVITEIAPLLAEYWFDAGKEAKEATDRLLQNW